MFKGASAYGRAGAHYRNVDVTSRIEGASPHRLVAILYEELLVSLAGLKAAVEARDDRRRREAQARALTLLAALESSIDFERGGDIAPLLASCYSEAKRLVGDVATQGETAGIEEARKIIGEIATAWAQIG